MPESFRDKSVIVTGAASGLGRGLAEELCRRGGRVVLADISPKVEEVAEELRGRGGQAWSHRLDVSQPEACQELVDSTCERLGSLDFMFNNAGQGMIGELRDVDLAAWTHLVGVNGLGVFYGAAAAYRVMIRQGSGHIVNTASIAGLVPFPGLSAYCVTKTSVVAFSRMLRMEGRHYGVRVTALCPGLMRTGILEASHYLQVDREEALATNPFPILEVEPSVRCCLKGVERNQALVVFPFYARVLWWAYSCCPWMVEPIMGQLFARFRSLRSEKA